MFNYEKTFNDLDLTNKCKAFYVICCILILLICLCSIICVYDTYYGWYDLPNRKLLNIKYLEYNENNEPNVDVDVYYNNGVYKIQYRVQGNTIGVKLVNLTSKKVTFVEIYNNVINYCIRG